MMFSRALLAKSFSRKLFYKSPFLSRVMSFHFASGEYASCFVNLPQPDTALLRQRTLEYLESFDPQAWHEDPIVSLLKGHALGSSPPVDTKNALGAINGKQVLASPAEVEQLKEHIRTYQSPYIDLRMLMRDVEAKLLDGYSGLLIGNQCLDFQKQDGVTEIEEAIMANAVERRLNDLLLRDEGAGKIRVNRQLIYVSCVSNFTNFLDLFRKTIRSLEVGVPCVILGRSNTSQHSFRWTKLLMQLMEERGIDSGMLTFLSCSLDDIKHITNSCQEFTGNLYTTCSRPLAAEIKTNYPKTVASTGGPNTMVTTELTPSVESAIQTSASIECAGQCTALRHCVIPLTSQTTDMERILHRVKGVSDAPQALRDGAFDGVFPKHKGSASPDEEYNHLDNVDAFYKVSNELPPSGINEYWRKVVIDFSRLDLGNPESLDKLAAWLNENQPISLAINAPREQALKLGLKLFDKTGMVVNTIGSSDDKEMPPALTCQARPQDAEVFGEFPPRRELQRYSRFPVVIPSSNPSYDATYSLDYLISQEVPAAYSATTKALIGSVAQDPIRGYCVTLIEYLRDVGKINPKYGYGSSRTSIWGLQRPPIGTVTVIRCGDMVSWDSLAPVFLLFFTTNARQQVELSFDPANDQLIALCTEHNLPNVIETTDAYANRMEDRSDIYNVFEGTSPLTSFPMAGNFVSLYFPLGHIKSTKPKDEEFVLRARLAEKWLSTLF